MLSHCAPPFHTCIPWGPEAMTKRPFAGLAALCSAILCGLAASASSPALAEEQAFRIGIAPHTSARVIIEQYQPVRRAVEAVESPFRLAALHTLTTLSGSLLIALAVLHGRLSPAEAWAAAHVDETYQAEAWGRDAEAEERLARRWAEFEAAATVAVLA